MDEHNLIYFSSDLKLCEQYVAIQAGLFPCGNFHNINKNHRKDLDIYPLLYCIYLGYNFLQHYITHKIFRKKKTFIKLY